MSNNNFVVKNGLTVNGSFTANSTVVNAAAIQATSVNAATLSISSVSVATLITGNAATAYTNATTFASNATNLSTGTVATARLGSGTANSSTFLAGDQSYKTAVTSVATGGGLTGGTITGTGTVAVNANNGIVANSTGTFVFANTGLVANATGLHINAAYIGSLGGGTVTSIDSGNGMVGGPITGAGTLSVRANNGIIANASGTFVFANTGLVANVTGLHVNAAYIQSLSGGGTVTSVATGNGMTGGTITGSGTVSVLANSGIVSNSLGTFVNANNGVVANSSGVFVFANSGLIANSTGLHVNTAYVNSIAVTNVAAGVGLTGGGTSGYVTVSVNPGTGGAVIANTSGTFVNANNGLIANTLGLHVNANSGIVANSLGTFVNPSSRFFWTNTHTFSNTLTVNSNSLLVGNGSINTVISFGTITFSNGAAVATVNSTYFTGTANNSDRLSGQPQSYYTNATNLSSGLVGTARLATTGTANSTTFLRGDQAWSTAVTSVATGNGISGGTITGTGTLVAVAGNGVSVTAGGINVVGGTGVISNTSGVFVNAAVTNVFTVGTGSYFVQNGNFGVGTSSPSTKLFVEGNTFINGYLSANGGINVYGNPGPGTSGTEGGQVTVYANNNTTASIIMDSYPVDQSSVSRTVGRIFQDTNSGNNCHLEIGQLSGSANGTVKIYTGNYALAAQFRTNDTQFTGNVFATGDITAYYSDIRLKKNINPIKDALQKVKAISGVTYISNDLAAEFGYTDKSPQIGVLAQEIEGILPEVVKLAPFDSVENDYGVRVSKTGENYKTVQYERIIPLLIEAIKELSAKVEDLEKR